MDQAACGLGKGNQGNSGRAVNWIERIIISIALHIKKSSLHSRRFRNAKANRSASACAALLDMGRAPSTGDSCLPSSPFPLPRASCSRGCCLTEGNQASSCGTPLRAVACGSVAPGLDWEDSPLAAAGRGVLLRGPRGHSLEPRADAHSLEPDNTLDHGAPDPGARGLSDRRPTLLAGRQDPSRAP